MRRLPYGAACSIGLSASTMPSIDAKRAAKARTPAGRTPLLPDDKILELRALSEFAGWSARSLSLRFGIDLDAVRRFLSGVTRSRLVATRAHLPAEVVA